MKILHITPSSNGYEEVELIANRVNRKNSLAVIKKNGEQFFTGGYLIADTPVTRNVLDSVPKNEQYEFLVLLRMEPFVKDYHEQECI